MIEIRKTDLFANWLDNLRDIQAKARVLVRIERLSSGNVGDASSLLVKVFRKCESTTVLVIVFTSSNAAAS
jgi:putative addiction module killer protein